MEHMPSKVKSRTEITTTRAKNIVDRFAPALLVVIFALVFGMGVLWQKVNQLEKGITTTNTTGNTTGATTAPSQQQAAQPPNITIEQIKKVFNDPNVVHFGDVNKKLLLVEVADPSCPYCHIASGKNPQLNSQTSQFKLVADGGTYVAPVEEMRKLVDQGKAAFAYVFFPGHGNGEMGMKAMYCADEKGKFWAAHDLLMTSAGYDLMNTTVKNDKSQSAKVADFLKNAVDPNFMKQCLDSGKYDNRLTADTTIAQGLGVQGTPGFYVNTTNFAGAYSYKDMQSVVDAALK